MQYSDTGSADGRKGTLAGASVVIVNLGSSILGNTTPALAVAQDHPNSGAGSHLRFARAHRPGTNGSDLLDCHCRAPSLIHAGRIESGPAILHAGSPEKDPRR